MAVIQRFGGIDRASSEEEGSFARGLWAVATEFEFGSAPSRTGMVRLATVAQSLPQVRQDAGCGGRGTDSVSWRNGGNAVCSHRQAFALSRHLFGAGVLESHRNAKLVED